MTTTRRFVVLIVMSAVLPGCAYIHRYIDMQFAGAKPDGVVENVSVGLTPNLGSYNGNHPNTLTLAQIDALVTSDQQPFACETIGSELADSSIESMPDGDNNSFGVPARPGGLNTHSENCGFATQVAFYYKPATHDRFVRIDDPGDGVPGDAEEVEWNGNPKPFVVRIERGVINRFIYTMVVPAEIGDNLTTPDSDQWNKYLIYYFHGGVGIGKIQGKANFNTKLLTRMNDLRKGYGVVMSTGTETAQHYNMWVAYLTAKELKGLFTTRYTGLQKTIGIGESGGAIQQYLMAEFDATLLDGLIPIYSYPDVETQAIYVNDCELLEYYFDKTANEQERWGDFEQRELIEGLSVDDDAFSIYYTLDNLARLFSLRGHWYPFTGVSECSRGWRLNGPFMENPHTTHRKYWYSETVRAQTKFDHYDDLKLIFGTDTNGFAHRTFDNRGVQYGLRSLQRGEISWEEFLHLNANIGGWKPADEFTEARLWVFQEDRDFGEFSLWSHHNMTTSAAPYVHWSAFQPNATPTITPAPRTTGHSGAMTAAYKSGHVFTGKHLDLSIPILDVRHYLDPWMDIHHSFASFSTYKRIEKHGVPNMKIWMAKFPLRPNLFFGAPLDPEAMEQDERDDLIALFDDAVDAMRAWLQFGDVPEHACFHANMDPIDSGPDVWQGALDNLSDGSCTEWFPLHESPRNAAGMDLEGDVFWCDRVDVALANPLIWAPLDPEPWLDALAVVFPDGVCDYALKDKANPW